MIKLNLKRIKRHNLLGYSSASVRCQNPWLQQISIISLHGLNSFNGGQEDNSASLLPLAKMCWWGASSGFMKLHDFTVYKMRAPELLSLLLHAPFVMLNNKTVSKPFCHPERLSLMWSCLFLAKQVVPLLSHQVEEVAISRSNISARNLKIDTNGFFSFFFWGYMFGIIYTVKLYGKLFRNSLLTKWQCFLNYIYTCNYMVINTK